MTDSKLIIRECDGSGYNEFKSDFQQHAVLQDIESVLKRDCPPVITDAIAAGEWGDDLRPCEGTGHDNGTAAPAETPVCLSGGGGGRAGVE